MVHIEVIPGIRFREVFIGALKVPLANRGARVIARRGGCEHAKRREKAGFDAFPVEATTKADLLDLEFPGAGGDALTIGAGVSSARSTATVSPIAETGIRSFCKQD